MSFIAELKRRNVVRVGIAYALIAWIVLQAADFVLEVIGAPGWVLQVFVLAAVIGMLAALIFAWVFELTPEGLKRESEIDRDRSVTRKTGKKLDTVIMAALVAAVIVLGWDNFFGAPSPDRTEVPLRSETAEAVDPAPGPATASGPDTSEDSGRTSIAVLPFVNMSADAENEFFSDGVSEEILNVLARIPELKVAARTSAFAFKGTDAKVSEIARELGVNHVLEGSVRKAGDRVRVTAQLIQAGDGFHLWSETYDRQLDDIFAIQDEIAEQIASALRLTLALDGRGGQNLTGTSSLAAYEHYLRGMALWHERTADSLRAALDAFSAALTVDPGFAKAHAGLALTWSVYPGYITTAPEQAVELVMMHAGRALELDPENTDAMAAQANALATVGRLEESAQLYERAIELSPSFATAYQWYGRVRLYQGEFDQAQQLMQRAYDLDPRSRIIIANLAWAHLSGDQLGRAEQLMRQAWRQHPDFPDALSGMLVVSLMTGACEDIERLGHHLASLLRKEQDRTERYLALCMASDSTSREAIFDEMLGWGPIRFADPASEHLMYDIEFWTVATHFDAQDVALEILRRAIETWGPGELGWMRSDRRSGAVRFNCSEEARALYDAHDVMPMANAIACE
ncbi:MAG: tetratricopeptide repeat protein [Gammaproteobacteria bacterium]